MDSYHLEAPLTIERNTSMFGQVTVTFEAGTVTPKNEAEQAALDHAVDLCLAKRIPAETRLDRISAQPAAASKTKKPEEATE